jgi:hypothetical protein
MSKKMCWGLFIFYAAIFGSFCGLELNTFIADLPFFQWNTLVLFINVLFALLVPLLVCALTAFIKSSWNKRIFRTGILILNSIYFHLVILFLLYKSDRHTDFDFYFFWYNLSVSLSVLWKLYAPWLFVIVLSLAVFAFFQKAAFAPAISMLQKSPRRSWLILAGVTLASLLCQIVTIHSIRGSTAGFIYTSFFSDRQLRTDYRKLYADHITALENSSLKNINKGNPSILGDVVIVVQQESLNSLLINPKVTPRILNAAKDGILFNQMYGNSIQSERGYECILCGVPPSMAGDLVEDYDPADLKNLKCLPSIFKALGYQPIVFYSGNPNPRVIRLFKSIGFEKILADDIVQPGDVMYDWGYREDTFFTRVDEYLQKHYTNEKLFIFITASATNHTPFKVHDKKLLDKIPFPEPSKFEERLSNTTFVQDAYFGHLYEIFQKHYAQRGSLIAVSDHSWPIPRHKNNIYNERGAYEENFLIGMLLVPPSTRRGEFATGSVVTRRFSQMDIVPTILDLTGVDQNPWLGKSFAPWLLSSRTQERIEPPRITISVQPYGGGFISAVQYPTKYLFDALDQNVQIYNLEKDPWEKSPELGKIQDYMHLIKKFFQPAKAIH